MTDTDSISYAQQVVVNITAEMNGLKSGNQRLVAERDRALAKLASIRDICTTEHESKCVFIARVNAILNA